ncbi:hypothetical protein [Flavobacterium soyangense]|uniref:Uncharacterized protein n=1 Tax=Flavobacterium soyangense TaxID=2023265 RepID=A0A930UFV9_9FLAO|nr:hypothetical protein [Flavobacterium soyangense]MBF2710009.1 hypothetical protein [Flavobacterium soyangense]
MIQNEYKNVKEVSQLTSQSTRNVRRIIKRLEDEVGKELLHQDNNNMWMIHNLLLGRFKPQRIRTDKYYALSVDPCYNYSEKEIDEVMKFVMEQMSDKTTEINYVIEQKKANNQNHIHCYVKCSNKKKLMQCIRLGFSQVSYCQTGIFDLAGWKKYITKDNNNIKTIKN